MQITFDPLNLEEVAAVCQFINRKAEVIRIPDSVRDAILGPAVVESPAAVRAEVAATIAQADRPDVGVEFPDAQHYPVTPASAAPLEQPAPLPAAADLFGTAPVAPPVGDPSGWIAPVPPVPTAPPVAPAPSANALPVLPADAVDKHGLPWDERIHSGTRVKNADGSWRQRRGVDAALVKTVEEELRALMAIPTRPGVTLGSVDPLEQPIPAPPIPAPAGTVNSAPATNATEPSAGHGASIAAVTSDAGNVPPPPVPAPPTSAPATAPIPSPPVPPAPTAAEPTAPLTFATMLRKVTDALAQGKIKETDVHAALEKVGLSATQIGLLSARTDLIPAFDSHITATIGAGHA